MPALHTAPSFFPALCPSCGQQEGIPIGATVGSAHGSIVVDLRCRACRTTWTEQLPKPTAVKANGSPLREPEVEHLLARVLDKS